MSKCYYCQLIKRADPSYSVRIAEFDLNSPAPRCPLHWRYICKLCKKPYHFMSVGYCSDEKAFFCENCALNKRYLKKNFYLWEYYFEYKSPWSKKFVASLDWLEYSNRHPFVLKENNFSKRIYKYLSKEKNCKSVRRIHSQNIAKESVDEKDVSLLWGANAEQWDRAIGEKGDIYRKYVTDHYLLKALGNLQGLEILDIGCGNGYLCRKLKKKGSYVTGTEVSEEMLKFAQERSKSGKISYLYASATDLSPLDPVKYDRIIFNYVLTSVENCQRAISQAVERLKPSGLIYIINSHPCFSSGPRAWHFDVIDTPREEESSYYCFDEYFSKKTYMVDSWEGFSSIPYFHRTLEEYWTIFNNMGLVVEKFIEPKLPKFHNDAEATASLSNTRRVPMSCFFILRKAS